MRDESKNEGRTRDDRNFNGWVRDRNISVGAGFALFDRRDEGYFKINGGMRDEKQKIPHYRRYVDRELRSKLAGLAYKHSEWSGKAGLTRTEVTTGCRIENAYRLDPPEE